MKKQGQSNIVREKLRINVSGVIISANRYLSTINSVCAITGTVQTPRPFEPSKKRGASKMLSPSFLLVNWSGRGDLNSGPPEPHSGALPGCATSRKKDDYGFSFALCQAINKPKQTTISPKPFFRPASAPPVRARHRSPMRDDFLGSREKVPGSANSDSAGTGRSAETGSE